MKTLQAIRAELEAALENTTINKMVNGELTTCSETERASILDDRARALFNASTIPEEVSFRSLAFALDKVGLYEQVRDAARATITGEIWWNTALSTTVRRDHPFVAALAQAVGQTSDQLDAIFIAAKAL